MYGLGFENEPLSAENCTSTKTENLKLLKHLRGLSEQSAKIQTLEGKIESIDMRRLCM